MKNRFQYKKPTYAKVVSFVWKAVCILIAIAMVLGVISSFSFMS